MNIIIELELCKGINWPIIKLNGKEHQFDFIGTRTTINLESIPEKIVIENCNKNELETIVDNGVIVQDQTVKISSFYYDNICLEKDIIINNSQFLPKYHASFINYAAENNLKIEESLVTDTFYFNGIWTFEIKINFWDWYTKKINEKLCSHMDQEQISNYIGVPTELTRQKLARLKKVYNEV